MNKTTVIVVLFSVSLIAIIAMFGYLEYTERTSPHTGASTTPDTLVLPGTGDRPTPASSTTEIVEDDTNTVWSMTDGVMDTLRAEWPREVEDVIGHDTPHYVIEYSKRFDWFSILIFAEPAAQYRKEAESELLRLTGMSQAQACNFKVYVQRSTDLTGPKDFQDIGLSFCPGSVSDIELLSPYFSEE